jgi:hypothetical protein
MILLARFAHGDALAGAAHKARASGYRPADAFTPFPIDGLAETLETQPPHIRVAMFIGGAGVAALAYAVEWYRAVLDYPIDSGGRPLHSWPTFVLFPFAIGILAAAISGLIAFFWQSGLPRLHHPLFDADGFERVSQDAFLLAFTAPDKSDPRKLRTLLRDAGALAVWEMTP